MKIHIPKHLSHLPVYNGFPVPFTVFVDHNGVPHFKINDERKNFLCFDHFLCSVCGKPLNDDMWFVGGQLSAFHPRGAFNDPPTHKACAIFALQTCPYMVTTKYMSKKGLPAVPGLFFDPTQTMDRLPFFCLVRTTDYTITSHALNRFLVPKKPYLEVEYWRDGTHITKDTALELLAEDRQTSYLPL